jgi:hypothetical protein
MDIRVVAAPNLDSPTQATTPASAVVLERPVPVLISHDSVQAWQEVLRHIAAKEGFLTITSERARMLLPELWSPKACHKGTQSRHNHLHRT